MTLKQIALQRRDALLGYLRGYHGPRWRIILKARGIQLGSFEGSRPRYCAVDQADRYCHTIGFRWASDGLTCERNPAAVWSRRSRNRVNELKMRDFHALLSQSEYLRFKKILPKLQERAKSLAKAGQSMGYGIPSFRKRRRTRPRTSKFGPKWLNQPGGQTDPRLSLTPPRAAYTLPVSPLRWRVNTILNGIFKRLPPESWELSMFTDSLFVDKRTPPKHIPLARSSVENKRVREVGGEVAGTHDWSV